MGARNRCSSWRSSAATEVEVASSSSTSTPLLLVMLLFFFYCFFSGCWKLLERNVLSCFLLVAFFLTTFTYLPLSTSGVYHYTTKRSVARINWSYFVLRLVLSVFDVVTPANFSAPLHCVLFGYSHLLDGLQLLRLPVAYLGCLVSATLHFPCCVTASTRY